MPNHLENLLQQFAARRGIASLEPEQKQRYLLVLDGSLQVSLFQNGACIYLEGSAGVLSDDPRQSQAMLEAILAKTLVHIGTYEATLSLEPDSSNLVLFRRLNADETGVEDLEQALEEFANQLEFWRKSHTARTIHQAPAAPLPYFIFP